MRIDLCRPRQREFRVHVRKSKGLRDPTRTTVVRKAYEKALVLRFKRLRAAIVKLIAVDDAFGLKPDRIMTNRAFAFARNPDKINAFMEWLQQQEAAGILQVQRGASIASSSARAWQNVYIDTAYQRGISEAGRRIRGAGGNVENRWIDNAFNRPIHADAVGTIYTRAYSELRGITAAMDSQISGVLAQGLAEGLGARELANRIADRVDKIGITRARALARTETIQAYTESTLNSYEEAGIEGVEVEAEFTTAGDDQVCEECQDLEGKTYPIEEARGMIPVHPNCLPGDTLVLARDGISAATKRWYNGDLVVVRTASGNELACTPNHPILTDRGWVPARLIDVGCNVISDGGREWKSGVDDDRQDVPSRIEDVAKAARQSLQMTTVQVPVSAPDFHGDGVDGDIAIISAKRHLRNDGVSHFGKHSDERSFVRRCVRHARLASLRAKDKFRFAAWLSSHRILYSGGLPLALVGGHALPLDGFGSGLASSFNAGTDQQSGDGRAATSEPAGDSILGGAPKVIPHDHFADRVVFKGARSFAGHVYNLQTPDGFYSANGIVTHNCRCAFLPVIGDATGVDLR